MQLKNTSLAIVFSLLCLISSNAQAQQPDATTNSVRIENTLRKLEEQSRTQILLLQQLIDELKQNRITTQLNNVNLYRLQMLTDSLNSQQIRVESISAELDLINEQIIQAGDSTRFDGEIRELEAEIKRTADPQLRATLTQTLQTTLRSIEVQKEQMRRDLELNRVRQQNLQIKLQTEKARLQEIEEKIDAMDKHFQRVTSDLVQKGAR